MGLSSLRAAERVLQKQAENAVKDTADRRRIAERDICWGRGLRWMRGCHRAKQGHCRTAISNSPALPQWSPPAAAAKAAATAVIAAAASAAATAAARGRRGHCTDCSPRRRSCGANATQLLLAAARDPGRWLHLQALKFAGRTPSRLGRLGPAPWRQLAAKNARAAMSHGTCRARVTAHVVP